VQLAAKLKGRKVVVFGLPGAYTGPCSTIHLPSFIRTAAEFAKKGVAEIICIAVNDPFVLKAWGEATGATAAGITLLGDADGSFTKALKMDFTAPPLGLLGRSNRYAAVLDDGVVTQVNIDKPGVCEMSTGEALLAKL
jgi:peroxiredoxin